MIKFFRANSDWLVAHDFEMSPRIMIMATGKDTSVTSWVEYTALRDMHRAMGELIDDVESNAAKRPDYPGAGGTDPQGGIADTRAGNPA